MKTRKTRQPTPKTGLADILDTPAKKALLENYVDEILKNMAEIEELRDAIKVLKSSATESLNMELTVLNKYITELVEGDVEI